MTTASLIKYGAAAIAGMLLGLTINAWRYGADISDLKADHSAELKLISDEAQRATAAAIERMQAAEQSLSDLDAKHTKELSDAQAENDRLRNAVADGTRRLRVAAKCPANSGDMPEAPGAAGVDNDGTVELSPAAGRNVLDIRAGVISDQAKLRALQQYVREVCLK